MIHCGGTPFKSCLYGPLIQACSHDCTKGADREFYFLNSFAFRDCTKRHLLVLYSVFSFYFCFCFLLLSCLYLYLNGSDAWRLFMGSYADQLAVLATILPSFTSRKNLVEIRFFVWNIQPVKAQKCVCFYMDSPFSLSRAFRSSAGRA